MVPENEFHHKEQPARSATPASQQNGPGTTGKPTTSTNKTDEGASEDGGEWWNMTDSNAVLLNFFTNSLRSQLNIETSEIKLPFDV